MFSRKIGPVFRRFGTSSLRRDAAYEGPGKTTVTIFNEDLNYTIVSAVNRMGFVLNNNVRIFGPTIILPDGVYSWRIQNVASLTEDAFSLFQLLHPRPEVVFFGYGARFNPEAKISEADKKFRDDHMRKVHSLSVSLRRKGLNFDALPTEDAIAAYNVLCLEERLVAAALIPPESMDVVPSSDQNMSGRLRVANRDIGQLPYVDPFGLDEKLVESWPKSKDGDQLKATK